MQWCPFLQFRRNRIRYVMADVKNAAVHAHQCRKEVTIDSGNAFYISDAGNIIKNYIDFNKSNCVICGENIIVPNEI